MHMPSKPGRALRVRIGLPIITTFLTTNLPNLYNRNCKKYTFYNISYIYIILYEIKYYIYYNILKIATTRTDITMKATMNFDNN